MGESQRQRGEAADFPAWSLADAWADALGRPAPPDVNAASPATAAAADGAPHSANAHGRALAREYPHMPPTVLVPRLDDAPVPIPLLSPRGLPAAEDLAAPAASRTGVVDRDAWLTGMQLWSTEGYRRCCLFKGK